MSFSFTKPRKLGGKRPLYGKRSLTKFLTLISKISGRQLLKNIKRRIAFATRLGNRNGIASSVGETLLGTAWTALSTELAPISAKLRCLLQLRWTSCCTPLSSTEILRGVVCLQACCILAGPPITAERTPFFFKDALWSIFSTYRWSLFIVYHTFCHGFQPNLRDGFLQCEHQMNTTNPPDFCPPNHGKYVIVLECWR